MIAVIAHKRIGKLWTKGKLIIQWIGLSNFRYVSFFKSHLYSSCTHKKCGHFFILSPIEAGKNKVWERLARPVYRNNAMMAMLVLLLLSSSSSSSSIRISSFWCIIYLCSFRLLYSPFISFQFDWFVVLFLVVVLVRFIFRIVFHSPVICVPVVVVRYCIGMAKKTEYTHTWLMRSPFAPKCE